MAMIQIGARIILGLIYFVFGLMGLAIVFGFMPMPDQTMPEAATAFMKGMMGTGYFFPLLKSTEAICGFLILIAFAAPLALVVLAPVTLHVFLFHFNLTPGVNNLIFPGAMLALHLIAMTAYEKNYRALFSRG